MWPSRRSSVLIRLFGSPSEKSKHRFAGIGEDTSRDISWEGLFFPTEMSTRCIAGVRPVFESTGDVKTGGGGGLGVLVRVTWLCGAGVVLAFAVTRRRFLVTLRLTVLCFSETQRYHKCVSNTLNWAWEISLLFCNSWNLCVPALRIFASRKITSTTKLYLSRGAGLRCVSVHLASFELIYKPLMRLNQEQVRFR